MRKIKTNSFYFRPGIFVTILVFLLSTISPVGLCQAQSVFSGLDLPAPGTMVQRSFAYSPALLKGLEINPEDPFQFEFIIDHGEGKLSDEDLKKESMRLVKYFLTALTVPEDEIWVNLSPYEGDKIIPPDFGRTGMGKDLLSQDYLLKQFAASVIYPELELGEVFWKKVYAKAGTLLGVTDIPVNTFNKVWIMPDKAVIYEYENKAYVTESRLRVMLEEDYQAFRSGKKSPEISGRDNSRFSSEILRDVILPEIEKEVNQGKNFAVLRQVYHSLILAAWFKRRLRSSVLGQVYVDQNKVEGIDLKNPDYKEDIYQKYLAAYKKGVYDYIREDYDPRTEQFIARRYFSGGFTGGHLSTDSKKLAVVGHDSSEEPWDAMGIDPERSSVIGTRVSPMTNGQVTRNADETEMTRAKDFSREQMDHMQETMAEAIDVQREWFDLFDSDILPDQKKEAFLLELNEAEPALNNTKKQKEMMDQWLAEYLPVLRQQSQWIVKRSDYVKGGKRTLRQFAPDIHSYISQLESYYEVRSSEEYETLEVLSDLLKGSLYYKYGTGLDRARTILQALREADVAPRFFSLMKEPGMAVHYKEFIAFYKRQAQKRDVALVQPRELRQEFIESLGTAIVYRAVSYHREQFEDDADSGAFRSKFLKKGGSQEGLAEVMRKYGLPFITESTLGITPLPDKETGDDGRDRRLLLSVSVVDETNGDRAQAEKIAEAIARQTASGYARANLIAQREKELKDSGAAEQNKRKILELFEEEEIVVIRAEVPRFFLIQQTGQPARIAGDINFDEGGKDPDPKFMPLYIDGQGSLIKVDQMHDPNFEALIDQIKTGWVTSAKIYPLSEGIGHMFLGIETKYRSPFQHFAARILTGITSEGTVMKEFERKTPGREIWISRERANKKDPEDERRRAFTSLGAHYGANPYDMAYFIAATERANLAGDAREIPNLKDKVSAEEQRLYAAFRERGIPEAVLAEIKEMIKIGPSAKGGWGSWGFYIIDKYEATVDRNRSKIRAGAIGSRADVVGVKEGDVLNVKSLVTGATQDVKTAEFKGGALEEVLAPLENKVKGKVHRRQRIVMRLLAKMKAPPGGKPRLRTFKQDEKNQEVIEDLEGRALPENKLIVLLNKLANHRNKALRALAFFHEAGEYLGDESIDEKKRLELIFEGDVGTGKGSIKVSIGDSYLGEVQLTNHEAREIIVKDVKSHHYLLWALQRELFGELDVQLTKEIQKYKVNDVDDNRQDLVGHLSETIENTIPGVMGEETRIFRRPWQR